MRVCMPHVSDNGKVGDTPTTEQCEGMTCVMSADKCAPIVTMMSDADKAKADSCAPATSAAIHNEAFVTMVMSLTAFLMW
jgi:hypothetical protein